MTATSTADKTRLMAQLGALPPGTRMIEYTHTYTKTYTNHYYKLIHETEERGLLTDGDDDQDVKIHSLIDHLQDEGFIHSDDPQTPEAQTLYEYLHDQDQESYDSYETDETFDGVELIDANVKYDPNNSDHQGCIDDYIREWETDKHNDEQQQGARNDQTNHSIG